MIGAFPDARTVYVVVEPLLEDQPGAFSLTFHCGFQIDTYSFGKLVPVGQPHGDLAIVSRPYLLLTY